MIYQHHQNEFTRRKKEKLHYVRIVKKPFVVKEIAKNISKSYMKSQPYLNVISVPESLDLKERYVHINKLFIQKWIVMFADKKSTTHLSLKDIKLLLTVSYLLVRFIVKIVHYFFEVKKISNIILQTSTSHKSAKYYIQGPPYVLGRPETSIPEVV